MKWVYIIIGMLLITGVGAIQLESQNGNADIIFGSVLTNYSTVETNASEIWITNEGDMDNIVDLYATLDGRYPTGIDNIFDQDLNTTNDVQFSDFAISQNFTMTQGNAGFKVTVKQVGALLFPYIDPTFLGGVFHVGLLEGGLYLWQNQSSMAQLYWADAGNPSGRYFAMNWADNNDFINLKAQGVAGANFRIDNLNVTLYSASSSLIFGLSKDWYVRTDGNDLFFHNDTYDVNMKLAKNGTLYVRGGVVDDWDGS